MTIQKKLRQQTLAALPYWIAGIVTGILASAYAILFKALAFQSADLFSHHFLIWAALVPIGFTMSFYMVKRYSPEAAGSGIPQVMAAIHHHDVHPSVWLHRLLGIKVVAIKIISSLFAVTIGAAIGREGPTIQIGASVFNFMGRFIPDAMADDSKKRRALILAGGASGIAAAFNTPLGGIVFAIEELATDAFREFRTTVLVAVIVAGMTAQWIMGSYLYLGHPAVQDVNFYSVIVSVGVSIVGGIAGGFFGSSLFSLISIRRKVAGIKKQFYWIFGLSLLFVAISYFTQGLTLGPGTEGITGLLKNNPQTPFWHPIARFAATQISYLVGGAGGIFSPALSIGANLGSWAGSVFFSTGPEQNVLVIVGMISFLTGVTHAPLTSLVLVIEMIDRPMITFPMMLGSLIAYGVTRMIQQKSFYERMSEYYIPEIKSHH